MGKRNLGNNARHAIEALYFDMEEVDKILASIIQDGHPMPSRSALEARILKARLRLSKSMTRAVEVHPSVRNARHTA